MVALENPDENPCFGCGPRHGRGLHLSFEETEGENRTKEVVCAYTPRDDEIGWPGLMHIGLLFLVMMETSYWAALTLSGRVHTVTGPVTYDPRRLPRVGRTFRSRARIEGQEGQDLLITCVAEDANARAHATMTSTWRRASRAAVASAGLFLPPYLLDSMTP